MGSAHVSKVFSTLSLAYYIPPFPQLHIQPPRSIMHYCYALPGAHVSLSLSLPEGLWDGMLEGRIRLHKLLSLANSLPQSSLVPVFLSLGGEPASSSKDTGKGMHVAARQKAMQAQVNTPKKS